MLGRLLVSHIRPYWPSLIAVLVFQAAQVLLSLTLPKLNADIINNGVLEGDTDYVWRTGGLMLLLALGQLVTNVLAVFFGARIAMRVGRDLRRDVFARVSSFSEREVTRFGAASLITRTTNDVQQVQLLSMMGLTMLVSAPLLAIGGVIAAIQTDAQLSWLIAVAVPLMVVFMAIIISRMVPVFRTLQDRVDGINRVMREQLTGIRVVRAFVQEPRERARFDDANGLLTQAMLRTGNLFVLMFPVIMLVLNLSSIAVIWFGGHQIEAGELQIGTLMAFLQYLVQVLSGVMMATFMTVLIPRAAVSAGRIGEVLGTDSSVVIAESPVAELPEAGRVELDRATFTYPGAEHPVLEDVSFVAAPGDTVAIIGSTGAGKTTLVGLIPRLFDATGGRVLVGGVDVRDADPDALWAQIGLVPQKPFLFSGTIASNLRYGNPDATDEELWEALEIAQAADFVRDKDGQLEAPIAQGGTNVSGGQRQRLAIARALVKRPPVLVFDDAFSALDLRTDARLRAALTARVKGTTKIIVAQRVSTIIDADQILVLDGGRVVGEGTHEQLLETNDTYREIVDSQLGVRA